MITWTKRLFLTFSFLALIVTNVLTLTSTAFNAALSGFISTAFGVQTVSDTLREKLNAKNKALKKQAAAHTKPKVATRKFGNRLASRTKRVAAASVAAIPGEAIPFLGISLLIAGTTYELYAACDSMKDLDILYSDMGMEDETPDDVLHTVCNPSLPDAEQVWDDITEKYDGWLGNIDKFEKLPLLMPDAFMEFP